MARERFAVFNTAIGETLVVIEMDDSLLRPEAGIVDPASLTMRPIKGGDIFTLIPAEDHAISALRRVHTVYRSLKEKPCRSFFTLMERTDDLIEAVDLLFAEVEYTVVESAEDMTRLINPMKDHEFKTVKHSIFGNMLAETFGEPTNVEESNSS